MWLTLVPLIWVIISPISSLESSPLAGELVSILVMCQPFFFAVYLTPRWSISSFHGDFLRQLLVLLLLYPVWEALSSPRSMEIMRSNDGLLSARVAACSYLVRISSQLVPFRFSS